MEPVNDICTNFTALPTWAQSIIGYAGVLVASGILTNWIKPDTKIGRIVNVLALYFRKK